MPFTQRAPAVNRLLEGNAIATNLTAQAQPLTEPGVECAVGARGRRGVHWVDVRRGNPVKP